MLIEIKTLDEPRKRGIYCITNLENNKIYIGSTLNSFNQSLIYVNGQKLMSCQD